MSSGVLKAAHLGKGVKKKLFLFVLCFAVFATTIMDVVVPLFLTDIANTFQVQIGTASAIRSSSAIAGVIFGLLMAILSARFRHKSLLLIGLMCECASTAGSFFAPSLNALVIFFFLDGVGSVIVAAMAYSMIGDFYPSEGRGKAIGFILAAGGGLAFVLGAPIIGIIAEIGTWRSAMLWFALPVTVVSLILSWLALYADKNTNISSIKRPMWRGLKELVVNKSAMACIVGLMFFYATYALAIYLVSFWKQEFLISTSVGSITIVINSLIAAGGSIIAGYAIDHRVGRKVVIVTAGSVESIFVALTVLMPTFFLSWGFSMIRIIGWSAAIAGFNSLSLEQTTNFRGVLMSLSGAFSGMGLLLGITVGGIALNAYNYQTMGLVLGTFGVIAILIIIMFARDKRYV
jgi:MFS transporter, DHA1 family, inner membrane transport protein